MKRIFFLSLFPSALCFLFVITAAAQDQQKKNQPATQKYNVVREGIGIEGLIVGKSTMDDVVKKFGKEYSWLTNKKYSYQMTYSKLGLSFYICQADKRKEIFDIEMKSPYLAKTGKGIILNKSTVEDVGRTYGKLKSGLEYRGVSFYYTRVGGKRIVTTIDVTENAGIRQCKEIK